MIRRRVTHDFTLIIGGPSERTQVKVAFFKKGELLRIRKVTKRHEYPKMYRILGYPQVGTVSRGVLTTFLRGFEGKKQEESG